MKKSEVYVTYAQCLLWVVLMAAVAVGVSLVVMLVFVDFVHGNPHRSQANAVFMMVAVPPIFGVIAIIGSFLIFTVPQCFQAIVSDVLVRRLGRRGQFGILILLPLTAILAWYCYDYFTPSDVNLGINAGPDWAPYQHGLTEMRYLTMLIFQTPITLFNLAHGDAVIRHGSRTLVVLWALVLAIVVGGFYGYWMAMGQYQFL
jgi:hypothetical protein